MCQNRCQMSKKQTSGLWRRFTKKINSHNEVHTHWCQFWCHICSSPKTLKMSIESIFDQFWWPLYLTLKLTSICVNIIVSIYFLCEPPPYSRCLTFWYLTSFWQLDIFWHFNRTSTPSQREIFFQDYHTLPKRNIFSNCQGRYIPLTRVYTLPKKGNYLPKSGYLPSQGR